MATGATGTPTAKGLPTINPNADSPDGSGITSLAQAVDTLADKCQYTTDTPASGEVPIWNGSAWAYGTAGAAVPSDLGQEGASTGDVIQWSGSAWTPTALSSYPQTVDRVTSALDIVSTVTETTVYTYTIAANALGTDRLFRALIFGDYLHNATSTDTVTWRVKFGGTTIFQDSENFNAESGANRQPWRLDLALAAGGATNLQWLNVLYTREKASQANPTTGIGNTTFNAFIAGGNLMANSTAASADTTSSQAITVTAQWSASSANNSLRRRYAIAELV